MNPVLRVDQWPVPPHELNRLLGLTVAENGLGAGQHAALHKLWGNLHSREVSQLGRVVSPCPVVEIEQGPGKQYIVTDEVVKGRQRLFPISEPKNKSA